jgi:hypothetical protein
MHISLFVLGVVTAAAGFVAIGYGIPVNEFSFGNTLIVAGTIAVVGGFILIGLAAAVRQLLRIAEADALRQISVPLPVHPADPFKPLAQSDMQTSQGLALQGLALHPAKPIPSPRAPPPPEPKLAMAPSVEPEPLEWLRPKEKAANLTEQSLIEEMEASLSPQLSPRVAPPAPKVSEPVQELKLWPPANPHDPAADIDQAFRPEPAPQPPESASRSAPPAEHAPQSGLFEAVWPEIRPTRNPESIARTRKPDTIAPARDDGKAGKDFREAQPALPQEPRPTAILKSGKIDGMAYTLYADGSIEAVLASGTIRFASIDALRLHLEKNG